MYNGNECLNYIEIYGGITEGKGVIEFMDPVYSVAEGGTNAVVRLIRRGGLNQSVSTLITTEISTLRLIICWLPSSSVIFYCISLDIYKINAMIDIHFFTFLNVFNH